MDGVIDAVTAHISAVSTMPAMLFCVIVAATFLLEDAATIAAALLASQGVISVDTALAALIIGIAVGDFALYGAGRLAAAHGICSRWIKPDYMTRIRSWAADKTFAVTFTSRFVPGLRLPTYLAAGFVSAPLGRFLAAVILATALWTLLLFGLVYFIGNEFLSDLGIWKWVIALAMILVVVTAERSIALSARRGSGHG